MNEFMFEYVYHKNGKYFAGSGFNYEKINAGKKIPEKDFLILFGQQPTETEIQKICKDFQVQEKSLHKFKTEKRSLRYSLEPLVFELADYFITKETDTIKKSHLLFVLKKNILILIVDDSSHYYKELFEGVTETMIKNKTKNIPYILYEFLHQDTKDNYNVIEKLDDQIAETEQKIIESKNHDHNLLKEIMTIKKELNNISKMLWASSKIIFTLKKELTSIKLNREEMALLDDIYDTLLHQIDLIETQKQTLTDFLEIYTSTISNKLALISNDLNIVMKKMTALTIIIMVPTLIAGIYGMNFKYMPEIMWQYGYFLSLGLMVFSASLIYYFFHKRKWI